MQVTVNSITANLLPTDAGLITGPISVCQGTFATYTVPPIPNANSYTWTFPDGRVISGVINKVTVYHPINAISGDITVRGTNSYGNGVSSTLALTVNSFPVEAGSITGPTNVSIGQKSVKYTVTPIANATSYEWSLNNISIGTSSTNSILIDYDQGRH